MTMGSAVAHKHQILHNPKDELKNRTVSFLCNYDCTKFKSIWSKHCLIYSVFPVSHKEVHGNIVIFIKEDKNKLKVMLLE